MIELDPYANLGKRRTFTSRKEIENLKLIDEVRPYSKFKIEAEMLLLRFKFGAGSHSTALDQGDFEAFILKNYPDLGDK